MLALMAMPLLITMSNSCRPSYIVSSLNPNAALYLRASWATWALCCSTAGLYRARLMSRASSTLRTAAKASVHLAATATSSPNSASRVIFFTWLPCARKVSSAKAGVLSQAMRAEEGASRARVLSSTCTSRGEPPPTSRADTASCIAARGCSLRACLLLCSVNMILLRKAPGPSFTSLLLSSASHLSSVTMTAPTVKASVLYCRQSLSERVLV
mmetsp:Transcript_27258/g.59558  ORF Transcript_27258/g.59558 Transcript_27258/m.59558 type:complete len:213 (-) Transcript_27258:1920-2558(-)